MYHYIQLGLSIILFVLFAVIAGVHVLSRGSVTGYMFACVIAMILHSMVRLSWRELKENRNNLK